MREAAVGLNMKAGEMAYGDFEAAHESDVGAKVTPGNPGGWEPDLGVLRDFDGPAGDGDGAA